MVTFFIELFWLFCYSEKKSTVPAIDAAMQNAIPAATDAAAASFYPNPGEQHPVQ